MNEQKQKNKKIIAIDKHLINMESWIDAFVKRKSNTVFIYALDRCTIGVSPTFIEEWSKKALYIEKVEIVATKSFIAFELPDEIYNFYLFVQPETTYSISGQNHIVLISVMFKSK